jgi:hypothetical protein
MNEFWYTVRWIEIYLGPHVEFLLIIAVILYFVALVRMISGRVR